MSTYVIAEAGVNHNGSLDRALELIQVAAHAGADAVKFQTFRADELATSRAPKSGYQLRSTSNEESSLAMLRSLELEPAAFGTLAEASEDHGIEFMSTPFDAESLRFLVEDVGMRRIKVPSGELTNGPLLLAVARTRLPVILSTGMSTIAEVREALGVLAYGATRADEPVPGREVFLEAFESDEGRASLEDRVAILHCTTEYPAPVDGINLRAMDTLSEEFGLPVGLSDHSEGIHIPIAAVARGAQLIEKHFTLDRSLPGPDHRASLEPAELGSMIEAIRDVERALGDGAKRPTATELENRLTVRRSLVAARPLSSGSTFSEGDLTAKRPGSGVSPMAYWEYLGRRADRDYQADELIAS